MSFCVANFCNKLATMPVSTSPSPGIRALAVAGNCSCMSERTCKRRTSSDATGTGAFSFSGPGIAISLHLLVRIQ